MIKAGIEPKERALAEAGTSWRLPRPTPSESAECS